MSNQSGISTIKRGRPPEAERAARKSQILDAAIGLFTAHGFAHTTIGEIAEQAGVTKRTLYVHFGDKAGIFTAGVARLHDSIEAAADHDHDLESLCAALVYALHSEAAVGLHRLIIGEAIRFPDLAAEFYTTGPKRSIALLRKAISERGEGLIDGHTEANEATASNLYTVLLGEAHRKRLLGLQQAPTKAAALTHARTAIQALGLN
jgi:TetR/AcrR family transcriptional repressor of mexJK operon